MMNKHELLKNKIIAAALVILGLLSFLLTVDLTILITVSMFAVPLFFAKENWIK